MNELKKLLVLSILVSFFTSVLVSGFIVGVSNAKFLDQLATVAAIPGAVMQSVAQRVPGTEKAVTQGNSSYAPQTTQEQAIIDTVKKGREAVVSVIATKDLPVIEQQPFIQGLPDDLFREFFEGFGIPRQGRGTEKQQVSAGSGFLISPDGMIITNKHVVTDAQADYTVLLNDGTRVKARVLARDPIQDIAIMKIDRTGLPFLALGDSDKIQVGQTAIAIGNALGEFGNTVSVGVISGLSRTITAQGGGQSELLEDIIQTDAAINPGNSGGPLLNLRGEVVGINTAVAQGAENIGFAIPINKAKRDIAQVETQGKISYAFLGVRYQIITPDLAAEHKLPVEYGAWVTRGNASGSAITAGSPAEKAGIKEGDIILEFNGTRITSTKPLAALIAAKSVGDTISLKVLSGGAEKTVSVTLAERK